jgi:hypothetical protein
VRVSGRSNLSTGARSIYISGLPGTLYSDGTFEFRGVPPGRHLVMTRDNPRSLVPLAAVAVVGDREVTGLQLEEVFVLPPDFQWPPAPVTDTHVPGSQIKLAGLRGRVIDETTRQFIADGILYISGQERGVLRLHGDGSFEIPHLLPGDYKLEIQVFGHTNISQTIHLADEDIQLELTSSRVD